jgi:UDP-GlcNAc3NAcA epimerase
MKMISIVGARPRFIKCAPLSRELRKVHQEILVHTGQHYDHDMSDILFCPTQTAVDNLGKEGIMQGVHLVGDVMLDALDYNLELAKMRSKIIEELGLEKKKYLVTTVHRPGNTDSIDNMRSIIEALGDSGIPVVFPVHPGTQKCLQEYGLIERMPGNVRVDQAPGISGKL